MHCTRCTITTGVPIGGLRHNLWIPILKSWYFFFFFHHFYYWGYCIVILLYNILLCYCIVILKMVHFFYYCNVWCIVCQTLSLCIWKSHQVFPLSFYVTFRAAGQRWCWLVCFIQISSFSRTWDDDSGGVPPPWSSCRCSTGETFFWCSAAVGRERLPRGDNSLSIRAYQRQFAMISM